MGFFYNVFDFFIENTKEILRVSYEFFLSKIGHVNVAEENNTLQGKKITIEQRSERHEQVFLNSIHPNEVLGTTPVAKASEDELLDQAIKDLKVAIESGDMTRVERLVVSKKGVLNWEIALHCAAGLNHSRYHSRSVNCVKLCLEKGANPNEKFKGSAPLHEAARQGDSTIIRMLAAKGANMEIKGGWYESTPLHWAIYKGDLDTVNLLMDLGADIESTSYYNSTPLYWACYYKFPKIVRALLARGADPDSLAKANGSAKLQLEMDSAGVVKVFPLEKNPETEERYSWVSHPERSVWNYFGA